MDSAELDKINERLFLDKEKLLEIRKRYGTKWVIDNIECVVSRDKEKEISEFTFRIVFKD